MKNYHNNAVHKIELYKQGNTWVFDDKHLELVAEAFVCGASEAIQYLVDKVSEDKKKPTIIFGEVLGEYDIKIDLKEDLGTNAWYTMFSPDGNMDLWLCPVLTRYFKNPPETIYIKIQN